METPDASRRRGLVYEGKPEDVSVSASVVHDHGHTYEFIHRGKTFFTTEVQIRRGNDWVKIEKPDDAQVGTFEDQILLQLRTDWKLNDRTVPRRIASSPPISPNT